MAVEKNVNYWYIVEAGVAQCLSRSRSPERSGIRQITGVLISLPHRCFVKAFPKTLLISLFQPPSWF